MSSTRAEQQLKVHRSILGELDEALATAKGVKTDGRGGGGGEIEMGEGGTTPKGMVLDGGEGRREREGGEGGAVKKGAFVDVGERRGQRDLGERVASSKRLRADGDDASGEHAS